MPFPLRLIHTHRFRAAGLLALAALLAGCARAPEYDPSVCAGPPLSIEAREQAMQDGYDLHPDYRCITRASYDAVQQSNARHERARQARLEEEREALASTGATALAQERHGFVSAATVTPSVRTPLPYPPPALFVRSDYRTDRVGTFASYVTPDPKDGRRHPAIVWLTGGDSNALDDFWTPGPADNDQSVHAFRDAGVVMMFPTLRGSHGQQGAREFLLGEADDVMAAANQLAKLSYVDPARIYLGGHSTGGTLALLVAAQPHPFRAVFAFGPVARSTDYPAALSGIDFSRLPAAEARLRSPLPWIGDVSRPTYIIEGDRSPANAAARVELCSATDNPLVRCRTITGATHFSVLSAVTPQLADDILEDRLD